MIPFQDELPTGCPHAGVTPLFQRAASAMYCKAPRTAAHVGALLGLDRRAAGMLLGKMRKSGLVRQVRWVADRSWELTRRGTRVGRAHELCGSRGVRGIATEQPAGMGAPLTPGAVTRTLCYPAALRRIGLGATA